MRIQAALHTHLLSTTGLYTRLRTKTLLACSGRVVSSTLEQQDRGYKTRNIQLLGLLTSCICPVVDVLLYAAQRTVDLQIAGGPPTLTCSN